MSPTETERCIESLLAVFQRYAGREGDNLKLSKREFLAFMNTELASFTKVSEIQARSPPHEHGRGQGKRPHFYQKPEQSLIGVIPAEFCFPLPNPCC